MNLPREQLLIVGASVRAAAQAARRAGMATLAADLFADVDLRLACPTTRLASYPGDLPRLVRESGATAWMYTGGLENEAELVSSAAEVSPLWGNAKECLVAVRDPVRLAETLRQHGLAAPEVSTEAPLMRNAGTLESDSWLEKPLRSAAGHGIRPATGHRPKRSGSYLQRFVPGSSASGAYVANGRDARLIGVTQQWLMRHNGPLDSLPFAYAGSVGPLRLARHHLEQCRRVGQVLTQAFGLVGLFGVDFVLDPELAWCIEVNPRYTASMEVLDRAGGISTLQWHRNACLGGRLPRDSYEQPVRERYAAKRIIYARTPVSVDRQFVAWTERENEATKWPSIADIPHAGDEVLAGRPLTTVLAAGTQLAGVLGRIERLTRQVELKIQGN